LWKSPLFSWRPPQSGQAAFIEINERGVGDSGGCSNGRERVSRVKAGQCVASTIREFTPDLADSS
jgi:hypothetical protein